MVKMCLPLLDHPADCTSQEPLILRISDDFIPDDFMHLQNVDKITMGSWTNNKQTALMMMMYPSTPDMKSGVFVFC